MKLTRRLPGRSQHTLTFLQAAPGMGGATTSRSPLGAGLQLKQPELKRSQPQPLEGSEADGASCSRGDDDRFV